MLLTLVLYPPGLFEFTCNWGWLIQYVDRSYLQLSGAISRGCWCLQGKTSTSWGWEWISKCPSLPVCPVELVWCMLHMDFEEFPVGVSFVYLNASHPSLAIFPSLSTAHSIFWMSLLFLRSSDVGLWYVPAPHTSSFMIWVGSQELFVKWGNLCKV